MSAVVALACFATAVLVAFLALECLLGGGGQTDNAPLPEIPPFTVLMPAHDEAHAP